MKYPEKILNPFRAAALLCAAMLPAISHSATPLTPQEAYNAEIANQHCVAAVWPSIGSNYNSYKACLSERGVTPNVYTVSPRYVEDVHRHCWGEDPTLERALSIITVWAVQNSAPKAVQDLATFADTVGLIVELSESGIDMESLLSRGLPNIINDMLPPNIVDLPPRALSNYASYRQCLSERNLDGRPPTPRITVNCASGQPWSTNIAIPRSFRIRAIQDGTPTLIVNACVNVIIQKMARKVRRLMMTFHRSMMPFTNPS